MGAGEQEPDFEVSDGDLWLSDKYQADYQKFLKDKSLIS